VYPGQTLSERLAGLASEFQQGRPEAFDALVTEMRDRIYSLTLRALRDPGAAEDLAQETFVKAYRKLGTLKDPSSCERWLYQIAVNLVRDHGRRRQLERRTLQALSHGVQEEFPPQTGEPDAGSSLRRTILGAVDGLPEHHREVFVMREIQGLSHAEIASALDIPEGTVWSRLSFARRALQQKLRKEVAS
jgi:RNA polymerase sigma-70 factor (ECF subfamily)